MLRGFLQSIIPIVRKCWRFLVALNTLLFWDNLLFRSVEVLLNSFNCVVEIYFRPHELLTMPQFDVVLHKSVLNIALKRNVLGPLHVSSTHNVIHRGFHPPCHFFYRAQLSESRQVLFISTHRFQIDLTKVCELFVILLQTVLVPFCIPFFFLYNVLVAFALVTNKIVIIIILETDINVLVRVEVIHLI